MAEKSFQLFLDEEVHRQLKGKASLEGKTMTEVLQELVELYINTPFNTPND